MSELIRQATTQTESGPCEPPSDDAFSIHLKLAEREGRCSNPNLVWKLISELHAKRFRETDLPRF
jgi:hypothetical protein